MGICLNMLYLLSKQFGLVAIFVIRKSIDAVMCSFEMTRSRHWELLPSHHIMAIKGLHQPHCHYSQPVNITARLTSALAGRDEGQLEPAVMEALFTQPIFTTTTTIPFSVSPPAVSVMASSTDSCIFGDESSISAALLSVFSCPSPTKTLRLFMSLVLHIALCVFGFIRILPLLLFKKTEKKQN